MKSLSPFIKNIVEAGSFTYLAAVFRFLTTLVLARLLLPEEFGIIAMIQVFSGFILILRDAGFSVSIIRSKEGFNPEILHTASLFTGVLFGVLMVGLSFLLPVFYQNDALTGPSLVISLVFVLSSLTTVPQALLRKQLAFRRLGTYTLLAEIVSSAICIFIAQQGGSYWSLVAREIIFYLFLAIAFRSIVSFSSPAKGEQFYSELKKFKRTFRQFGLIQILEYGARNIDNLLIGKAMGDRALGFYSRAYSLIYIVHTFVLGIVNSVMLPTLEKDGQKGLNKFVGSFLVISLLAGLLNLALYLFPVQLVSVLWGPHWMELVSYLPYIGLMIFLQIPVGMFSTLFIVNHKDRELLWITSAKFGIVALSIIIGLSNGILSLLQWYSGGFTIYSLLLVVVMHRTLVLPQKHLAIYFSSIVCCAVLLVLLFLAVPPIYYILVFFAYLIWVGSISITIFRPQPR